MPALKNPRHEIFAQALACGRSASAAYGQAGFKPHRANAASLARKEHISVRVAELQEEQLAIHQQATAAAATSKQVTIESLIAEAEAARAKAMSEKGGAAAAVSALTAKAKLAGMWREKVDQHNTGSPVYERIERVIVEHPPQANDVKLSLSERRNEAEHKISYEERSASKPPRHWSE
ncbi:MAG: hypothetical protein WA728_08060 [Xanthobacteraceae bacterium]